MKIREQGANVYIYRVYLLIIYIGYMSELYVMIIR